MQKRLWLLDVRNSISSGHYILSTIHADKASSIPSRMYSLLETSQDMDQFLKSICRYIQIGIYVRGFTDKATHKFKREIAEVTEFYVTEDTNEAKHNVIYRKGADGKVIRNNPSPYLIDYLEVQGVFLPKELQNLAGEPEEETPENSMFIKDGSNNQGVIPEVKDEPVVTDSSSTQNMMFSSSFAPAESAINPSFSQGVVNSNNVVNQSVNNASQINPSVSNGASQSVFSNAFDSAVNAQQVNQNINQSQGQAPLTGSQTSESLFE